MMVRKQLYASSRDAQDPASSEASLSPRTAALGPNRVPKPRQDRSRASLERILEAAERLLADRDFVDISMADLARESGCAVGTVYGRIPGKDVLLRCLLDLYSDHAEAHLSQLAPAAEDTVAARAAQVVDCYVDLYTRHVGLVRAIALHVYRGGPDTSSFRRETTQTFRRAVRYLADSPDLAGGDRAAIEQDSELALLAALACAQNRIVLGERSAIHRPVTQKQLRSELPRLIVAYIAYPR